MAIHLTPTELAREAGLERREVISKCMEMGVPIFQGRIDKTLFLSSLKHIGRGTAPGRQRLTCDRAPIRRATRAPPAGGLESLFGSPCRRRPTWKPAPFRASDVATGSKTIADLLPLAAEQLRRRASQCATRRRRRGRTSPTREVGGHRRARSRSA